jgi:hypothetical protein
MRKDNKGVKEQQTQRQETSSGRFIPPLPNIPLVTVGLVGGKVDG